MLFFVGVFLRFDFPLCNLALPTKARRYASAAKEFLSKQTNKQTKKQQ